MYGFIKKRLGGMFDDFDDTPSAPPVVKKSKAPSIKKTPKGESKKESSAPTIRKKKEVTEKPKSRSRKGRPSGSKNRVKRPSRSKHKTYIPDKWFLNKARDTGVTSKDRYYAIREKLKYTGISGEDDLDRLAAWWMDQGLKNTSWRGEERKKKKESLRATLSAFKQIFGTQSSLRNKILRKLNQAVEECRRSSDVEKYGLIRNLRDGFLRKTNSTTSQEELLKYIEDFQQHPYIGDYFRGHNAI